MKTDDVDTAYENDYIFDIDCLQTMKGLDGREVQTFTQEDQKWWFFFFPFSLLPACCWCYITDTASFFLTETITRCMYTHMLGQK